MSSEKLLADITLILSSISGRTVVSSSQARGRDLTNILCLEGHSSALFVVAGESKSLLHVPESSIVLNF